MRLKQKRPEPHSASSGAGGPYEKAPSPPTSSPFLPLCYDKWTLFTLNSWTELKKGGSTSHLEDSFRVPNSFIGVLRDLQVLLLPPCPLWKSSEGGFSGLNFATCEVFPCITVYHSLKLYHLYDTNNPCYHSLKFSQLAFWVSWVHLGNLGHFYLV